MAEIAERAGATTVYSWGDSNANVTDYAVCKENSAYPAGSTTYYPKAVGSLLPNAWGLYDTAGNVWEHCRDDDSLLNLADAADPFKPACANGTRRRWRGGGPYDNLGTGNGSRASLRFRNLPGNRNPAQGFRVSMIVE
jgi:formylglycine-generating enzyme required for sulfatase activity